MVLLAKQIHALLEASKQHDKTKRIEGSMMDNAATWISTAITILGVIISALAVSSRVGMFKGIVETRLDFFEKKLDSYNGLRERVTIVEQSAKSAHHRIDEERDRKR